MKAILDSNFEAFLVLIALIGLLLFLPPSKPRRSVIRPTGPGPKDRNAPVYIGGGPLIKPRKRAD
jgi:hypothetical protein